MTLVLIAVAILAFWLWTPDKSRASLEAKYLAAPGDMIDLAGWRLHVQDSGPRSAPAVILIHGFGASLQTWDAWLPALSAHHRVIRFDLPGSGLSAPDPAGDYTDRRSIELLLALMNRFGLQRASLVGHSIGGRIAWTFAALHPERVDKLVLVAPDGFASPGFDHGKPPAVPAILKLLRYVLPKAVLRMNLAPAYANPATLTDALTTRYHDLMLAPGSRDALLARMRQTVLVDPLPLLKRIRAPTLLVWGERDAMIPFANTADYMRAITDVRQLSFVGVGHLPQEEGPAASGQAVAAFLDEKAAPVLDPRRPPT
ncbi:MAG: alpha/beta fold hydrolase [Pseudomonadota bacterium]|nr:alpha/beta fold hydrolase [Pseudomonadota bacterium]